MKHIIAIFLFTFLSVFASAQDSSKVITHEIGFNTVSLIKQLISNNPNSTLAQSPYDVFYNLYFHDNIGIRAGLGISNSTSKTTIEGESSPRKTNNTSINARLGVSKNFVKYNRLTINAFADAVYEKAKFQTANTSTETLVNQPFGSTQTVVVTTTSTDKLDGLGAQVGVGIKYNIYKHLSIYAEVPITFLNETTGSDVTVSPTVNTFNNNNNPSSSKTINSTLKITIPTTIYLVLRF